MVRGDIHYGVVACIQLYSGDEDTYYGVVACIQLYSGDGDIHYGVVACIKLYSGEGRHTLWCSSIYTIIQR